MTKEPLNIRTIFENTNFDDFIDMDEDSEGNYAPCGVDEEKIKEWFIVSLRQAMEAISPQYDTVSSDEAVNYGYQKAKEEIKQKTTNFFK